MNDKTTEYKGYFITETKYNHGRGSFFRITTYHPSQRGFVLPAISHTTTLTEAKEAVDNHIEYSGEKPKKSEPANPDLTYYKFTRKNDWFVTNQSGLRANSSNNSFMILFWASIRNKGIGEAEPLKLLKDYGWRFKYSYTIEEGSPVPFAEDSYKRAKMKLDEKPKEKKTWNYYTRTKFKKDDDGKLKPTLIDSLFLSAFASVLTKGAKKYGKDNWKECDDLDRYKDALERHWLLYKTGQKNDRETGISHLAHIACSAMFLFYFDMEEKILDYVDFEVGYKK